jgi:hypothetical protein
MTDIRGHFAQKANGRPERPDGTFWLILVEISCEVVSLDPSANTALHPTGATASVSAGG